MITQSGPDVFPTGIVRNAGGDLEPLPAGNDVHGVDDSEVLMPDGKFHQVPPSARNEGETKALIAELVAALVNARRYVPIWAVTLLSEIDAALAQRRT
jgi:hypothetical protein